MSFKPFALFFSLAALSLSPSVHGLPEVTLPGGTVIQGTADDSTESFLGIQYGQVGRRFARSTLRPPSTDLVNATAFGPDCHQTYGGLPEFIHQLREEDEECLYLNVWRPVNASGPLSTMVWIHGGGLAIGSGAETVYDGTVLAGEQNVIVVTINYRLGVLGLLPQDETGFGGLNAVYDQIVALQWIKKYISSFGGDPDSVTVFGESSGGEAICMLSVSPLAKGLFRRAIQQSGECINNLWSFGVPSDNIGLGLNMVDQLLEAAGANSIDDLANSTKFPAAVLQSVTSVQVGWPVIVVDKEVLPEHPRFQYTPQNANNLVPTDIMVGSNSFEDLTFWGVAPEAYVNMTADLEGWVHGVVGAAWGNQTAKDLIEVYSPEKYYNNDSVHGFAQFGGDYYIGCPAREFASIAAKIVSGDVYLYNFAHFSFSDPMVHFGLNQYVNTTGWASHMAEIPFIFGTLDAWIVPGMEITSEDLALAFEMRSRWANFAKTGRPSIAQSIDDDGTPWSPVSAGDTDLPALVFESGASEFRALSEKTEQCSAFPFTTSTSHEASPEASSAGWRNTGAVLAVVAAFSVVLM